jgi:hypothetical protein
VVAFLTNIKQVNELKIETNVLGVLKIFRVVQLKCRAFILYKRCLFKSNEKPVLKDKENKITSGIFYRKQL